jgi:polyvinyl alcohol dehydrogenase (cytochrome)
MNRNRKQKRLGELLKWQCTYNWALFMILSLLFMACSPLGESSEVAPGLTKATPTASSLEPTKTLSTPTLTSTSTSQIPQIVSGDWPGYLRDNSSFNGDEGGINPKTAPQLRVYWKHHANGGVTAQSVVVNDTIYWGSWDGLEHATTLDGQEVWATNLGEMTDDDPDCDPSSVGVASTATIIPMSIGGKMTLVDFVGGGDTNFYALNAANGHIIWKTPLATAFGDFIWSSPAVYKGSIYVGVASFGDCPSVQGELVQLNAETGAIQNIFKVVPDGCAGGTIWSSPAIDVSTGELYISTGNFSSCSTTENYPEALIGLHASNLAVVGSWQVPPSEQVFDGDFGSTPTLFTATIDGVSRPMVGVINKNGIYYAFMRGAISAGPVWRAQISSLPRCLVCEGPGNISPAAWDGTTLYIAGANTTISGTKCQGDVRAVDPATGKFIWEHCFHDARAMAPIAVVPGIVVVGEGPFVNVLDATSGNTLFVYQDRSYGSIFYGAPSIAYGMLFVGNIDGNLFAFKYYPLHIHEPGPLQ